MVQFSLGATGCGTLGPPATGTGVLDPPGASAAPHYMATAANGQASVTYTSLNTGPGATTPVVCTVTVQEANTAQSTFTTVTQNPQYYSMTLTANPMTLVANSGASSLITATVKNTTGTPQQGLTVTFVVTPPNGNPPAVCGTLSASTATTNSSGQATTTYTANPGTTPGYCTITATEPIGTPPPATVTVDQTTP
jgi:hypothetical protein